MKQNPIYKCSHTHWWNDNTRLLCCPLQWLPRRSNIGSGPRPIHEIRQEMYQEQQPRKAHSGPPAPLSLPSQQPFRSTLSLPSILSLFSVFLYSSSPPPLPPPSSSSFSSPSISSSSSSTLSTLSTSPLTKFLFPSSSR